MIEEFRDIPGYEGLYQISNLGNVKSLHYNKSNRQVILKPRMSRHGYCRVGLHLKGKSKDFYIHRLVANAFLDNPNNLSDINHKDEDKTNNCVDNLEWLSHKENMNYGTIKQRISATLKKKKVS